MPRINEQEFLTWALKGNVGAVNLCSGLFQVSQVLDDLVDRDKPVTNDQVFKAFYECLVQIPLNPFYQAHYQYFTPLLSQYLTDWYDSTLLENEDSDHLKNVAFGLRNNIASLTTQCAKIIGGFHWMREVAIAVRKHTHEESLANYKTELLKLKMKA